MVERTEDSLDAEALSLDTPWAITESGFAAMVDDLRPLEPRRILEFGSGRSTVRLARAFPKSEIFSVEHDERFHRETLVMLDKYAPEATVRAEHRPLTLRFIRGAPYRTYQKPFLPESLDAVIIDGPSNFAGRGREAALYLCADRLRVGGRVYLDDFERMGERQIVANWLARYPAVFSLRYLRAGHQIAVLQKLTNCGAPQPNVGVTAEAMYELLRRIGTRAMQRLRGA